MGVTGRKKEVITLHRLSPNTAAEKGPRRVGEQNGWWGATSEGWFCYKTEAVCVLHTKFQEGYLVGRWRKTTFKINKRLDTSIHSITQVTEEKEETRK